MKRSNNIWRYIAKALGEKASKSNQEADIIASIRVIIFLTYLITNSFIIAGVLRHWNDEVPSRIPETKKEKVRSTCSNVL